MAVGLGLAKVVSSIVAPPTVPWTHDFLKDSVLKHATETAMYTKARYNWSISGDVTLLAAQGVEWHVRMARNTVACTPDSVVNIVEINKDMHDYQVAIMKYIRDISGDRPETWQGQIALKGGGFDYENHYPLWHNVKFTYGNIVNVKPTIFIDADLMGSLKTCGEPLKAILRNQRAAFPLGTADKGFIFTFIVRGAGDKESNFNWVLKELIPLTGGNCSLNPAELVTIEEGTRRASNNFKGVGSWRHPVHEITGPIKDVMIHSYSEGSGFMITGLIIYS
jgi:hypothetical protein